MKILFVANQLGGGGAERVLTLIANRLVNDNEVYILSFSPGVTKYRIDSRIKLNEALLPKKTVLRISSLIRKEVKRIRPDCFVSFEYHMNMKALIGTMGMSNVKKIVSERNDPRNKGGRFGQKQIRELLYMFSDVLVCQTPDAKLYFPKRIQRKSVIIPNPISDELPEVWNGEREHKIVNFCRLEKQKNIPLLIDAFVEFHVMHPDYTLEIFGDGTERDYLESYITKRVAENYIKLHHPVSNIHEIVKKAAMFVSSSDYEGLSNSMLEAMAIGLPVVCTDCPCGGARMVIQDGVNGFLIEPGSRRDLVKRMCSVVESEDVATRLSNNATKIRSKYNEDKIMALWLNILRC